MPGTVAVREPHRGESCLVVRARTPFYSQLARRQAKALCLGKIALPKVVL